MEKQVAVYVASHFVFNDAIHEPISQVADKTVSLDYIHQLFSLFLDAPHPDVLPHLTRPLVFPIFAHMHLSALLSNASLTKTIGPVKFRDVLVHFYVFLFCVSLKPSTVVMYLDLFNEIISRLASFIFFSLGLSFFYSFSSCNSFLAFLFLAILNE